MELAFVQARGQNDFFVELVAAIRDELDQLGVASSVHAGAFPELTDERVYVLVPPHEWFSLEGWRHPPTPEQLARSVFICAEQPDTVYFHDDARLGHLAGAVFDINASSPAAFRDLGLDGVQHLGLGWTRTWAHAVDGTPPDFSADARDLDVIHLGIASPHRSATVSRGAQWLSDRECRIVFGDEIGPNAEAQANFLVGDDKWRLLRRARVLLNIHVAQRPYFEWLRAVQAISAGCALVTEHSLGTHPLVAGRHFLPGRPDALGLMARGLLRDDDQRREMAQTAYETLRTDLPFSAPVQRLAEAGADILKRRSTAAAGLPELLCAPHDALAPPPEVTDYPWPDAEPGTAQVLAALKDSRLEMLTLRRTLAGVQREARGERPARIRRRHESPAWKAARPRVSIITPVYNHALHLAAALDSAARSDHTSIELIVVDDGSSDTSLQGAIDRCTVHAGLPALVLQHPVNRGLGAARNTALAFARGELTFVLDADNELYPSGLRRLVEVLDDSRHERASAAYGMLERFSPSGGDQGLLSHLPWQPRRLRTGNYIDAMALWRTQALRDLGGYTTDARLHGWEDYALWCRLAEVGGHAAMLPAVVARYRSSAHSMLTLSNLSARAAVSVLIETNPRLMTGVVPPQ